jgi:hypothetical protein
MTRPISIDLTAYAANTLTAGVEHRGRAEKFELDVALTRRESLVEYTECVIVRDAVAKNPLQWFAEGQIDRE